MLNSSRINSNSSEQGELLPTYPSDLIPEDHLSRVITEVVDFLNLTELYSSYGWEGGSTFHPKSMLKILFYAYSQGTRGSRGIQQQCRENYVYMYLGGSIRPDFRTISGFRKRHVDILKGLFKQIVILCYEIGMVKIGNIALDGTKIKANAANGNIVEEDKLLKELQKLEEQIAGMFTDAENIDQQQDQALGPENSGEELPNALKEAKERKKKLKALLSELKERGVSKMSLSDKDCRFMKSKGRIELSYNGQCATENQVILAYDLSNQEGDCDQLIPMVSELEDIASEVLQKNTYPLEGVKLATDAGYDSGKNLRHLKDRKIDAYIAGQKDKLKAKEQRGEIEPAPFSKDKFTYHSDDDYYECPEGKTLVPVTTQYRKKKTYTRTDSIYKGTECHQCESQKDCVTSKTGYRQISRYPEYDPYREEIDQKVKTAEGQASMRLRLTDVEPVFGQIKQNIFTNNPLLLRGDHDANGEFGLSCIVHNIKKIAKYIKSSENTKTIAEIRALNPKFA